MYRTRYTSALMVETFASSPIISINYEYLPVRWRTSFMSLRGGIGFLPGGGVNEFNINNGGGASFPVTATYNLLLNNLRKRIFNRVYVKCKSAPSRIASELFGETGLGYTFGAYPNGDIRHNSYFILGIRQQVIFDIPPHPRVLFLRANVTPSYSLGVFELRGGVSLGVSLK
ncbi:hypothetical protein [Emticicia agri]|uniref:Outer membrane protein beta-barrel domain-containing protein n=1 Tax=Emticicia agri TaxID=2492393 RepID=A0A4Q5M2M6_9BACT|nr:hypothetical protein [Emticicia agri]RYU96512.1 hypothetical protein EWM59_06780 [Emticicia agri]